MARAPEELRQAIELMERRGFKVVEAGDGFALMELRRMKVAIVYTERDYWQLTPIDDAIREFMLDRADSVIVVSERPYYLSDELNSAIEKANLLGRKLRARAYPVYVGDISGQLSFVLGMILVHNYDKIDNSSSVDGQCPSCGAPMKIVFTNDFDDGEEKATEQVIVCEKCGVRLHRFIYGN